MSEIQTVEKIKRDKLSLVMFLVGSLGYAPQAIKFANLSKDLRNDEQIWEGIARYRSGKNKKLRLHYYAYNGNFKRFVWLSKLGININTTTRNGYSSLMLACVSRNRHYGHYWILQYLCTEMISQVDFRLKVRNTGITAFSLACQLHTVRELKLLCKSTPLDVLDATCDSETTLMSLAKYYPSKQTAEVCEILVNHVSLNLVNKNGNSALHLACIKKNYEVIKILCKKADLNLQNEEGDTPLHIICKWIVSVTDFDEIYGHYNEAIIHDEYLKFNLSLIKLFCKYGADLRIQNLEGNTPLHIACKNLYNFDYYDQGHIQIHNSTLVIKILAINGAPLNVFNNERQTPIYLAIKQTIQVYNLEHEFSIIKLLYDMGSRVDLLTNSGDTALHLSCQVKYANHANYVELFFKNKKYLNLKDNNGDTPIQTAINFKNYWKIDHLCYLGADMNLQNNLGNTPCHTACLQSDIRAVQILCEYMFDLEIQNLRGETALHIACRVGIPVIVELICSFSFNLNLQDMNGDTVLHTACRAGNFPVVQILSNFGALVVLPWIYNNDGDSPMRIAKNLGYYHTRQFFDQSLYNINKDLIEYKHLYL